MSTILKVIDVTGNLGGIGAIVGAIGTIYYRDTIYSKKQDMFGKMMLCSAGVMMTSLFAGNIVYCLNKP